MSDPVGGLREMGRVTRPGGVVAACVWDHAGDSGPLSLFWQVVHQLDPDAPGEAGLAGAREGHLVELCRAAGLHGIEDTRLTVTLHYPDFEEWWEPFTLGVGPAGAYVAGLDAARAGRAPRRVRGPAAPGAVRGERVCLGRPCRDLGLCLHASSGGTLGREPRMRGAFGWMSLHC